MNPPVATNVLTVSSVDQQDAYSPSAQVRLDGLRRTVDAKLAALELALLDPSDGQSLETLILELARVATEEAQAAAAQACEDVRLQADLQIGQARAGAQSAIEDYRAENTKTTRDLVVAQQRLSVFEREHRDATRALTESFDAELAHERARIVELERTIVRLERTVADGENDRTAAEALRRELTRAEERIAALTEETAAGAAARRKLEASLIVERTTAEAAARDQAESQSALAVERAATASLRQAAARAAEQLKTTGQREEEARAAYDHVVAELSLAHQTSADLQRAVTDLTIKAESAEKLSAQLRQEAAREAVKLTTQLAAERAASVDLREAVSRHADETTSLEQRLQDTTAALTQAEAELSAERRAAAELARRQAESDSAQSGARIDADALRKTIADLRDELDRERETALQALQDAAVSESLTADELRGERTTRASLEKAVADLRSELDAERAASAEARQQAERADARLALIGQTASETVAAQEQLAADLARERDAAAAARRGQQELQATLKTSDATINDLRTAIEEAKAHASVMAARQTTAKAHEKDLEEALAFAREEIQTLRDDLESARSRLERIAGDRADVERTLREAESQLKFVTRERDELQAKINSASASAASAPATTAPASFPLDVLPSPAVKLPQRQPKKVASPAKIHADPGWVHVRMAVRYVFPERLSVIVNGQSAELADLSVCGCQIVSSASLKPNQAVKVQLPVEIGTLVCAGKIVWAKLEAPGLGRPAGYRAGVQFSRADESAIEAFLRSRGAAPSAR